MAWALNVLHREGLQSYQDQLSLEWSDEVSLKFCEKSSLQIEANSVGARLQAHPFQWEKEWWILVSVIGFIHQSRI